jgi:predicted pyridoxine 5'-phosphate oxidase superfamily flavin-nucleotide-binding protein
MDYPNRMRLKMLARAEIQEEPIEPALAQRVALPGYDAVVERVILFRVEAFDWNCHQHITPRYTEEELARRLREASGREVSTATARTPAPAKGCDPGNPAGERS